MGLLGACFLLAGSAVPVNGESLTSYGDIGQVAIPVVAGAITLIREDTEGLLQLGLTSAVTIGVTYTLQYTIDRDGPDGGSQSFPSGHTANAFMGASFLHYRYGWKYGFPAYAAAAVVGYSRVEADKHYWGDVVGAALLANIVAYVFTDTLDEGVIIVPFTNLRKKNFGITARIRF
jgi:membrane-associated phospholipid phosphatase